MMIQDQSQPQLQQQQYLSSQVQLQQQQCIQQTDSNLSAASYHSSGGASDEHPVHSTDQVCHHVMSEILLVMFCSLLSTY